MTDTVVDPADAPEPPRAEGSPRAEAGRLDDAAGGLAERDRQILVFERQWWKYAGAKEQAISDRFGISATRYYQVLNALIDKPEALAQDPLLVKRLRRLRSSRQKVRASRRRGTA